MKSSKKKWNKIRMHFEQECYEIIDHFIPILLLQKHTFKLRYGVDNQKALFECVCQYPYLNAVIPYSKQAVKRWDAGENMTPFIVHEMCHLLTDPLYTKSTARFVSREEIESEREHLTDYICNVVLKAEEVG